MASMMEILLWYLAAINILTFIIYGVDKLKARENWWRIPEATLLGLAAIGGSVGAWLGMYAWRHKTQHRKFRYCVPAFIFLQAALTLYLCSR